MATTSTPEPGTAVATTTQKPFALALLEQYGNRIEALLPPGVSLDRIAAALRLEVVKNPKIAECTPASLVMSLGRIFRWGLELGETAYLVPFYDKKKQVTEATAIMGYTGMVELMVASGSVRAVQARAVHANDQFDYELGLDAKLQHIPDTNPKTQGAITGAYCILRLGRGADPVFDYMSIDEIEVIRAKSKQWSPAQIGNVCPDWYAVKTIIRRTAKLVPKNPRLSRALAVIEEELDLEPADQVGTVAAPPTFSPTLADSRGPRPLAVAADGAYGLSDPGAAVNNAPIPPAQHSDDPGFTDADAPDFL